MPFNLRFNSTRLDYVDNGSNKALVRIKGRDTVLVTTGYYEAVPGDRLTTGNYYEIEIGAVYESLQAAIRSDINFIKEQEATQDKDKLIVVCQRASEGPTLMVGERLIVTAPKLFGLIDYTLGTITGFSLN